MNKDLKKFILFLIGSIIVAFAISYSYSAYQSHQQDKNVDKVKSTFNFGSSDKKVEDIKESGDPQEVWQEQRLGALESLGYAKVDNRPFYKRIYDKLTGKKVYNYKSIDDEMKTVVVEIKDNKITTLMGANGCGKSTLFQLLTKNLRPREGSVFLDQRDIKDIRLKEFAQNVAIVHQYNTAPPDLPVHSLIAYGRIPFFKHFAKAQDKDKDKEIVDWALEVTDMSELKNRRMGQLSGGQRQRAWIAMALAQQPKILLLDEPTTYLDVKFQIEILRLIKSLNKDYSMTIVMVLHDINQAIYYSDEIIGMKKGNILFQGNPSEVITEESIQDMYGIHLKVSNVENQKFVLTV